TSRRSVGASPTETKAGHIPSSPGGKPHGDRRRPTTTTSRAAYTDAPFFAASALATWAAVFVLNTLSFSSQPRRATSTPYLIYERSLVLCASGLMTSCTPSALARLQ